MTSRSRTVASLFTVAMAATLIGAFVTAQVRRPEAALARPAEAAEAGAQKARGGFTLDTFRDIARGATPGVVNINTSKVVKQRSRFHDFDEDTLDRFFGPFGGGDRNERQTERSLGSGFVIDRDGHILTNRHVVEGADEIRVTLPGQRPGDRPLTAKLVGMDARTDVALIKIDARSDLTVLPLGDSEKTEVGEWVAAIGNPFGLGGNSVTVGVVSYKGRPLTLGTQGTAVDMIQTDASINPGNSGGPLLNTRGEVIGINTLIITRGLPQSAGVGFAVPINVAREILPQLREKGKVVRGWLGVQIQSVTEDMATTLRMQKAAGAIVSDVTAGSPAEKAGVKAGDVVIAVDGRPVEDNGDLSGYIASRPPDSQVTLKVLREGVEKDIAVTLGTFPEGDAAQEREEEARAQLGMTLQRLTPALAERLELPRGTRGVVVAGVEAGEAAEEAGLQRGDVIVSVNGGPVASVEEFEAEIAKAKPDGLARLRVRRGDVHTFLILRLK